MTRQLLCFFVLAATLISCRHAEYRQTSGAAWGTLYNITYRAERDLSDSVVAEMRRVELSLSMFDRESLVSRINRGETDTVDERLRAVLNLSKRVHKASNGAFDPTVAPLVDLWGFGRKGRDTELPDSAAVRRALSSVGLDRCRLEGNLLVCESEGLQFDFSAVAKGYGADCVAGMLRRNGCTDYMVEIGGEIVVSGHNPYGHDWRISIAAPIDSLSPQSQAVLELTDCGIATSGNYRNYRRVSADSVAGHTINPRTGYPEARSVLSVTVVAPTCGLADALATAVMALPDTAAGHAAVRAFPATRAVVVMPDTIVMWN